MLTCSVISTAYILSTRILQSMHVLFQFTSDDLEEENTSTQKKEDRKREEIGRERENKQIEEMERERKDRQREEMEQERKRRERERMEQEREEKLQRQVVKKNRERPKKIDDKENCLLQARFEVMIVIIESATQRHINPKHCILNLAVMIIRWHLIQSLYGYIVIAICTCMQRVYLMY